MCVCRVLRLPWRVPAVAWAELSVLLLCVRDGRALFFGLSSPPFPPFSPFFFAFLTHWVIRLLFHFVFIHFQFKKRKRNFGEKNRNIEFLKFATAKQKQKSEPSVHASVYLCVCQCVWNRRRKKKKNWIENQIFGLFSFSFWLRLSNSHDDKKFDFFNRLRRNSLGKTFWFLFLLTGSSLFAVRSWVWTNQQRKNKTKKDKLLVCSFCLCVPSTWPSSLKI